MSNMALVVQNFSDEIDAHTILWYHSPYEDSAWGKATNYNALVNVVDQ